MSQITENATALPLAGIRVLDAVDGPLQSTGRILSDLGAEVIRIEEPGGSPARQRGITAGGTNVTFAFANAGKHSVVIDLGTADGHAEFLTLCGSADIVLRDMPAEKSADLDLSATTLRENHPELVVFDISEFGASGPKAGWHGSPDVHAALSTVLSRSGLPDVTEPLLPPEFLMYESAAVQAAWAAMLELFNVRNTGGGDSADFSVQEGLLQIFDPPFGMGGSARAGVPLSKLPRNRPDARHMYPIFPAKDGWVRICVLALRQWQGMLEWLGRPAELDTPKLASLPVRFARADLINPYYIRHFGSLTMAEAVEQGARYGVPTAALEDQAGVLREKAFRANGSLSPAPALGQDAVAPAGWFEIDDTRVGASPAALPLGDYTVPERTGSGPVSPEATPRNRPFEGIRVLDLGVIVVGAELGRLFADYGADVIKIESSAFPDGARTSMDPNLEITEGASLGLRNKRSAGVNLRSEEGKKIFAELVTQSDVILTNFKPGTLAKLGFDMATLQELNPGIILSESSAYGNHGPWSTRLGYGPLVRASAGLSKLWAYPGNPDGFSDAITVYPDHVVARVNAIAVAALLLRRDRTGRGGRVSTAQLDSILTMMADSLISESIEPGTGLQPEGNDRKVDAFRGVYRAEGDDEWLVVDAEGDAASAAVARIIGHPELIDDPAFATADDRVTDRDRLRGLLADWAVGHDKFDAADRLQAAGIPAGPMVRSDETIADPHLVERRVFGVQHQPQLPDALDANLCEVRSTALPDPLLNPATMQSENTREVLAGVLGLTDAQIDDLVATGAVEERTSDTLATN